MPITQLALQNAHSLGIRPERLAVLDDFVARYIQNDYRQAAVIKIQRHGVPIFEGCYGTSTRPYGVNPDTIFHVMSLTKPIIATLLLMLQEDGLVDLVEPVCRYLPEFTGGGLEKICLWHLLTHTSGIREAELDKAIGDYITREFGLEPPSENAGHKAWQDYENKIREKMGIPSDTVHGEDRMQDIDYLISLKTPTIRPPRSWMGYLNYGYQRLKDVIDAVTGEPIDLFARRVLFDPLGMPDTWFRLPEDRRHRLIGRGERCAGYPWINTQYESESGAGGLKSTVNDMTNFLQMILNGGVFAGKRLLSPGSVRQMSMNHNEGVPGDMDTKFSSWGLGWNIKGLKKDDTGMLRSASSLEHSGWAGQKILLDPEEEITAAMFTAMYQGDHSELEPFSGPAFNILYSALV